MGIYRQLLDCFKVPVLYANFPILKGFKQQLTPSIVGMKHRCGGVWYVKTAVNTKNPSGMKVKLINPTTMI